MSSGGAADAGEGSEPGDGGRPAGMGGAVSAGAGGTASAEGGEGGDEASACPATTTSGLARWDVLAPMAHTRTQHSATLLTNGKVLVVGGLEGSVGSAVDVANAELFDPCSNTWSSAGSLSHARNGHSAALLGDGRVLVVGGAYQGWSVAAAEIYNPSTNAWSPVAEPPAPGVVVRIDRSLALLIGAHVIDNTTALYDAGTDDWSPTGLPQHPRWGFEATLLGAGKVLISGGFSIEPYAPAVLQAELYDPDSGTWSSAGTLSRMRNGHAPVRLESGRVLISGGYPQAPSPTPPASTEIYDPHVNAWSAGDELSVARWIHSSTLLANGRVLIAGGSGSSGAGSALASAELYDENSDEFSTTASLREARWSHSSTLLPDGRVLVIGGNDGTNFLSSVEAYVPGQP